MVPSPMMQNLALRFKATQTKWLKSIFKNIKDIVEGISHEHEVELKLKTLSNINAARLKFNHPLVKSTVDDNEKT